MIFPKHHKWPWWVSIIIATLLYCSFRYVLPDLHPANPSFASFCQAAPNIAPIITIPFLLLGAKQLYDDVDEKDGDQP